MASAPAVPPPRKPVVPTAPIEPTIKLEIPDLEVRPVAIRDAPAREESRFEPLDFDEAPEGGLTLSLSFDSLPAVDHTASLASTTRPSQEQPSTRSPNGYHVLVVEDDADIAQLMRRLLEAEGYRVTLAADGEAGLAQLKQVAPDLLLLDAMLPKLHGFEIVQRVRSSRRFSSLPIVVVSAVHRGWRYAEDLRNLSGVHHYLEKPFDSRRLLRAVADALKPGAEPQIAAQAAQLLRRGIEAYKAGDLDAAQSHLEQGLSVDPHAFQLHFQLGLLHGKRGKLFDAIGSLNHAVELNPGYFAGVKNLALLYQKTGFRSKSTEMWERALALAPDAETKESIREQLRRLI
jgi:DNA-binding response OmpR family regulator